MTLTGAVDWYREPYSFVGWVRSSESAEQKVLVQALYLGEVISETFPSIFRPGDERNCSGFIIDLKKKYPVEDILSNKLIFRATSLDTKHSIDLSVYKKLASELLIDRLRDDLERADSSEWLRVLRKITSKAEIKEIKQISDTVEENIVPASSSILEAANSDELSFIGVRVGAVSPRRTIIVGRSGHLFLEGGSNGLSHQYNRDIEDPEVLDVAIRWHKLVKDRYLKISRRGIQFRQIFIPEKPTVLKELFPLNINPPTAYYRKIVDFVEKDSSINGALIDTLPILLKLKSNSDVFRLHDSHLTAAGSESVFRAILASLRLDSDFSYEFNEKVRSSDTINHFPRLKIGSYDLFPSASQIFEREKDLKIESTFIPENGGHIGRYKKWSNKSAQYEQKVLVFGNSFFEMGANALCLSWWFARWFSSYNFHWEPEINYDLVDELKPDIVICQTIERFLPKVPIA